MQSVLSLEFPSDVQVSKVFNPDFQPLSCLVKKNPDHSVDRTNAYHFLEDFIVAITAYFGAKWETYQIEEFAKDFFREYYFFNQADLRIFYNRVKSAEIKEYVFSPKVLMNQLKKYSEERMHAAEIDALNKKQKHEAEFRRTHPDANKDRDAMVARFEFLTNGNNDEIKHLRETIAKQSKYITSLTQEDK